MPLISAPPPVIHMARVLAYAIVDSTVQWTGRQTIFVGDELLGPVPMLVLAQDMEGKLNDVLIFHCDESWELLGISGADSFESAKEKVERAYQGISGKWQETNITAQEAEKWVSEHTEYIVCFFCGRKPEEIQQLVTQKLGAICNHCIDEFHNAIHAPEDAI